MRSKPSFLLLIFSIASIINSCRGYGSKKFSQSYSSSSASAHASSYSSSSSYTFGGGNELKHIPIAAVIPQANAIATASASAGAATASANAAAGAHSNLGAGLYPQNHVVANQVASKAESQFGSGSYSVGGSQSAANTDDGSYIDTHKLHNIIGTGGQGKDGSYSAEGAYSPTAANANGGSGAYSYSHGTNSHVVPSIIGIGSQSTSGSYSGGGSKTNTIVVGGSYPYNQGAHQSAGTVSQVKDGSYSAGGFVGTDGPNSYSNGKGSHLAPNTVGIASQSGSGSYSAGISKSTGATNSHSIVSGASYPYNQGTHHTFGTGNEADGSYSAGAQSSNTAENGHVSTGPHSYKPGKDNHVAPNAFVAGSQSGSGSYSAEISKSTGATNTHTIVSGAAYPYNQGAHHTFGTGNQADGSYSAGAQSSNTAENGHVSTGPHSHKPGKDDHVAPNTFVAGSQSGSGSYSSGGNSFALGADNHVIASGPSYPYNKGSQGPIGTGSKLEDGSYSAEGSSPVKPTDTSSYSYSNDKNSQGAPNTIGSGSHSGSGSYSAGGSSSAAAANTHKFVDSGSYAYNQGAHNTIGTGSQVKDGSYAPGNYNSVTGTKAPSDAGSHYYAPSKNIHGNNIGGTGGSSYSSGSSNTNLGVSSYSNSKDHQGPYHGFGTGSLVYHGSQSSEGHSYGTAGSKGSTTVLGSKQPDYSFEKNNFPSTPSRPGVNAQNVGPLDKPNKNVFPGPDGSIYDYKVPSQQNHVHVQQGNSVGFSQTSGIAHSGSYGGAQSIASSGNNLHAKPCCKGPFPGPSGSIHDSKSASAVGTAVKTSVSHPPLSRVTPKTPLVNFPGPSGSIYTSKPVVGNNNQERNNGDKWSSSTSAGTYQIPQDSSPLPPLPSCTQKSCTNVPKIEQQIPPITYLEPPVLKVKPVIETVKEEYKPNTNTITTYIQSKSPTNIVPHVSDTDKPEENYKPQISTPEIQIVPANTKSEREGNIQTTDLKSSTNLSEKSPVSPSFIIPERESNIKSDFSGTSSHSFSTSASQTSPQVQTNVIYSQTPSNQEGSDFGGVKSEFPSSSAKATSLVGDDEKPKKEDEKVYLSNSTPAVGYTGSHSSGISETQNSYFTGSVAVNTGLREGPKGSPFQTTWNQNKEITRGPSVSTPVKTEINVQPTHYKSTDANTSPQSQLYNVPAAVPQISSGGFSFASTNSMNEKGVSGDSKILYASIPKPVETSTIIEKQVPKVYTNGNRDTISQPVDISSTIVKQVPQVYTTTLYIDLNKPSPAVDRDAIIFQEPESFNGLNKKTVHFVSSGSHELDAQRGSFNRGNGYSVSGSNSYGSLSRGFSSNSAHRCNIPGCGTSYRHYSNAVPSSVAKTSVIHIGAIPSSGFSVGSDKSHGVAGSYTGSYGVQTGGLGYGSSQVGANGFSNSGSYGGTFPKKTPADGAGGFLSSIYLDGGSGATANAGSYAKAGSHSGSSSYSKANSYASSSSFASASSGSYSSHGY